jgi:hypothetical protein
LSDVFLGFLPDLGPAAKAGPFFFRRTIVMPESIVLPVKRISTKSPRILPALWAME